jgi:hypothetical protein
VKVLREGVYAAMIFWVVIIGSAFLIGLVVGRRVSPQKAIWVGALVPWLLLTILVVEDYFTSRPGAHLLGLAQLIGGSVVAICGALGARLSHRA